MMQHTMSNHIANAFKEQAEAMRSEGNWLAMGLCNAVVELPTECLAAIFVAALKADAEAKARAAALSELVANMDFKIEKALVLEGKVIDAIKTVRRRVEDFGLKEAKDLVESWPEYETWRSKRAG